MIDCVFRGLYGYCPQWALNWEYRKKGILDEIKHFSADIIALQVITYCL
jgi:CCR4-NOT transcription complex subunit 6